jgi:DNA-binding beta-propeller fold protein YncE
MDRRTFLGGSAAGLAAATLGVRTAFAGPTTALSDAHLTVSDGTARVHLKPGQTVEPGAGAPYGWRFGARDEESPVAVELDGDRLWVSDRSAGTVLALNGRGRVVAAATGLQAPRGLAVSPSGLLVCDVTAHEVVILDHQGQRAGVLGKPIWSGGTLNGPIAIALDAQGRAHVCDAGSRRIQVFDVRSRELVGGYGDGLFTGIPRDIAITADGRVHVADAVARQVVTFDANGAHRGSTPTGGTPRLLSSTGQTLHMLVEAIR